MNLETVVFGKGYLGTRMVEELGFESAPKFDVLDRSTLNDYLNTNKPKVVINAIGRTGRPNIDWCETHKEETLRSNVAAVICLAENCVKRGIYFVHFGSGCIYQGDKEFTEKDRPNFFGPQHYAKTKILAEEELSMMEGDILQLRIRMPIDDRSHERNLIDKLRKYSKVIDIQNSMTTVPHMLEAIKTLIEKRSTGIYNMTNPGTTSAFEIMQKYKEIVDPNYSPTYMSLEELDSVTLGKRSNCTLNTDKLQSEGIKLPEIHDAVEECLQRYK